MNPVCDRPDCMDPKRFIGGFPDTGHYNDDGHWEPHHFDETNHPSLSVRQSMRKDQESSDREHVLKHGTTLYHGTNKASAESIARDGFHLDNTANGRHSGHGVYLTKHKDEARMYGSHVVEAKVNLNHVHDDPWHDEDTQGVHPSRISAHLEGLGYQGHIDTDDDAHVIYKPQHVHVVKVHGPDQYNPYPD